MLRLTEPALNAWLCLPIGLLAAFGIGCFRVNRLALVGGLPFLAEALQWVLPQMGRSAFLLADVTANWSGMAYGAILGLGFGVVARARRQFA